MSYIRIGNCFTYVRLPFRHKFEREVRVAPLMWIHLRVNLEKKCLALLFGFLLPSPQHRVSEYLALLLEELAVFEDLQGERCSHLGGFGVRESLGVCHDLLALIFEGAKLLFALCALARRDDGVSTTMELLISFHALLDMMEPETTRRLSAGRL